VLSHRSSAAFTFFLSKQNDSIWEEYTLKLDDNKGIRDLNFSGCYLTVVLDRNEVQVIELRTRTIVFKAQFKDASGKVSRAFYIDPKKAFYKKGQPVTEIESSSEESPRFEEATCRF